MITFPKRIYKYFPPERIDVLDNGLIRYTPPSAFNDPFDSRPGISAYASKEEVVTLIRSIRKTKSPTAKIETAKGRKGAIRFFLTRLIENNPDMSDAHCLDFFESAQLIFKKFNMDKIDNEVGILSFTEIPSSLLMWSHYAAAHSGFVLGFDTNHKYFCSPVSPDQQEHKLKQVVYRSARRHVHIKDVDLEDVFLTKSIEWAYEREWRIIDNLSKAEKIIPMEPYSIHLFNLPLDAICEVIVGARASKEFKELLWKTMKSKDAIGKRRLKLAVPSSDSYSLLIRVVSRENLFDEFVW